MARPLKDGIDYFPLNVNLSDKFDLIEAEFGLPGFAVIIKLLQKIYREHGYFCNWSDEACLLFTKKFCPGLDFKVVSKIVNAAVKRGFFDKKLFDKFSILTSVGIQRRYFEAISRRRSFNRIDEYMLVHPESGNITADANSFNADINPVNVDINSINYVHSTQIKENKNKLYNIKQKDIIKSRDNIIDFYEKNVGELLSDNALFQIDTMCKNYPEDLIIKAIKENLEEGKTSVVYTLRLLAKWEVANML